MSDHIIRTTCSSTAIPVHSPSRDDNTETPLAVDEPDIQSGVGENDRLSVQNLRRSEMSLSHQVPLPQDASQCCRICLLSDHEPLISPCKCKGSLTYVHLSCLERWLNENGQSYCELCQHNFNVIQTPRYRMSEAVRLWVTRPQIRRYIQTNIFVCTLLTFVTALLTIEGILGIHYFIQEGGESGIVHLWSAKLIIVLVAMMIFVYLITLCLLMKELLTHWYKWWRRNVCIHVVLDPSTANPDNLNV
jgi:hypothetical protein